MSVQNLKLQIHAGIGATHDRELLETVSELLQSWDRRRESVAISEEQAAALDEAQEQIRRGEVLTDQEADAIIQRWAAE